MNIIEKLTTLVEDRCKSATNVFGYGIWSHHIKPMIPIAKDLASKQKADIEIVTIATLLHDYASIFDPDLRKDHHLHGAAMARKLLRAENYPNDKIEAIVGCIKNHKGSVNNKKEAIEEICVADGGCDCSHSRVPIAVLCCLCPISNGY